MTCLMVVGGKYFDKHYYAGIESLLSLGGCAVCYGAFAILPCLFYFRARGSVRSAVVLSVYTPIASSIVMTVYSVLKRPLFSWPTVYWGVHCVMVFATLMISFWLTRRAGFHLASKKDNPLADG